MRTSVEKDRRACPAVARARLDVRDRLFPSAVPTWPAELCDAYWREIARLYTEMAAAPCVATYRKRCAPPEDRGHAAA